MDPVAIATFAGFALIAGALIGCVGIGGVILVPLLAYAGGVPIHTAIAAAMFAYLVSGTIGTIVFARERSIRWDLTTWMWAGAMPAALAGALTASAMPAWTLELAIGLLTAASGIHSLSGTAEHVEDNTGQPPLSRPGLGIIGAVTGFASSVTGTGGPLVLVPILIWLQVPVLTAIGLSQAIQLPIAVLASSGNAYTGSLDLTLGLVLGAGISLGTWAGAKLAHALPKAVLRRFVSALLVAVGTLILGKLVIAAV